MSKTCDHGNVIDPAAGINCLHCMAASVPMRSGTLRAQHWPFIESPGHLAERLAAVSMGPGGLLAGLRTVLIEEPPTISDDYLRHAGVKFLF